MCARYRYTYMEITLAGLYSFSQRRCLNAHFFIPLSRIKPFPIENVCDKMLLTDSNILHVLVFLFTWTDDGDFSHQPPIRRARLTQTFCRQRPRSSSGLEKSRSGVVRRFGWSVLLFGWCVINQSSCFWCKKSSEHNHIFHFCVCVCVISFPPANVCVCVCVSQWEWQRGASLLITQLTYVGMQGVVCVCVCVCVCVLAPTRPWPCASVCVCIYECF